MNKPPHDPYGGNEREHDIYRLVQAARELADLMDEVRLGNYKPDSFTNQPINLALTAFED